MGTVAPLTTPRPAKFHDAWVDRGAVQVILKRGANVGQNLLTLASTGHQQT